MAVSYRVAVTEIRKVNALQEHQRPREFVQLDHLDQQVVLQAVFNDDWQRKKKTSKQMQGSTSVKRHHRGKTNVPSVGLVAQEHRVDLGDLSSVDSRLPPIRHPPQWQGNLLLFVQSCLRVREEGW